MEKQEAAIKSTMQARFEEQEALHAGEPRRRRGLFAAISSDSFSENIANLTLNISTGARSFTSRFCSPVSYAYKNYLSEETKRVLPSFAVLAVMITLGMLLAYFDNNELTVIETFYFAVTTSTTIG